MQNARLTLTVVETAKLLGIGRTLCYERVRSGEIPSLRIGRRVVIPRAALEKLLGDPKSLNLVLPTK
jgi:excisionase family DNA binding protein